MADPNPLGPLEIVLIEGDAKDEALDPEMDFAAYARTRDPALIKELHGMRARRWRVGGITRAYMQDMVEAIRADSSRYTSAFLAACHRFVDADGTERRADTEVAKPYKQRVASFDWLDTVGNLVGDDGISEIGRVAYQRARLPLGRTPRYA